MTPLPPGALQKLLEALPGEQFEQFPHLASLTSQGLFQRRLEITGMIKTLEAERKAIDEDLFNMFSEAELRRGLRHGNGWILRQRTRTSWSYPQAVKKQILAIQREAQRTGIANRYQTTYIIQTQEGD